MKEQRTWEKTTTAIDGASRCARAEDLVTYLYGEADPAAAADFLAHAQHCVSCRTELADFGHVRASIGEWRQEALGSLARTAATTTSSPVIVEPVRVTERKRSALAAIREFFSLSPVWMRAATAALGVAFCALVALTIVHYNQQPKIVTVDRIVKVGTSDAELEQLVNARLKQMAENPDAAPKVAPPAPIDTPLTADNKGSANQRVNKVISRATTEPPKLAATRKPKISQQESREIARDLRLTASNDEDDLPRLSDLIDESN